MLQDALGEARSLLEARRPKPAAELLEGVAFLVPEDKEFLQTLAKSYCLSCQYDKAVPVLRVLQGMVSSDEEAQTLAANLCCALRESGTDVKQALTQLLVKFPENPLFHCEMAYCAMDDKELDTAREHVLTALELSGGMVGLMTAAHFFLRVREFPAAMGFCRRVLALDPISSDAMQVLGDCHFNLEQYAEAADWYQKVVAYYPDTHQGRYCREQVLVCERELKR